MTERASLDSVSGLQAKVAKLKRLGFRIAIDDLGAGYAGLSSFSELEPEFVKLDMSLVRDVDKSTRRRSIVGAMITLCRDRLGVRLVSEGVETPGERDVLGADGCDLMQGHLFAPAARGFPAPRW